MQLVAYGTVEKHGGNGAVDTAAETEHHLVATHLLAQLLDSRLYEALGRPLLTAAADTDDEVAQQRRTVGRVVHLGVELYGIGLLALNLIASKLHVLRAANGLVARGQHLDGVTVTHPHLAAHGHTLHQRIAAVDERQVGTAVLAYLALLHAATAPLGQILGTVAHRQQRQLALDARHVGHRSVGGIAAIRAATENNTLHLRRQRRNLVKGMNLAVNIKLAYLARDKLSVLTTKV